MKYCLTSAVIAAFLLIPFVDIQAVDRGDNRELQEILEWWPTDANPGPVKDEERGGHWWWPNKAGQIKPWGNRGYVYVKGGYTTKPSESEIEEARKAEEKASKAKEIERVKRAKEEAARIKKAKELEGAARLKKAQEEAERIRKTQELEEAKRAKELEEAQKAKAEETARIKKAQELEEAKLAQKKDKKTEIYDTIVSDKDNVLLVTDFSSGTKRVFGGFAGEFGTWEHDPKDETQFCRMGIGETLDRFGKPDYFVRLNYDVDSPRPAFNGFWMKLNDLDVTPYEYVSFLVKGEDKFTTQFKIELKNRKGERVVYFISGITPDWQRIMVPLDKLKKVNAITDWTDMTEFVIVFDDILATEKVGTICIDDLNFAKFGWEKVERRRVR
ncbi:MAG: hypothetical protein FJZ16_04190 [Candidatus Omnitrophica bacterium]|nr:hypothetical protein [Candidatus Omnitrophota bacterium]